MPLSVIPLEASLSAVLKANSYTLGKLSSHPLAAPYVSKFDGFQDQWFATHKGRTLLEIGVDKAEGVVRAADDALDDFVDLLDRTLLIQTKNDRKAPLYQLFFGNQAPHQLKRPVLSGELLTCRAWIPTLQGSTLSALSALAPKLQAVVAAADEAIAQKIAAVQAVKDFETIGDMKTLVDAFNALRKSTYGDLGALPHTSAGAGLPPDFADRFFPHDAHAGITSVTNADDVQTRIDGLQKDLTAAQAHLADIKAKAAAKEKQKKAETGAEAELAAAKKAKADAEQKVKDAEKALKDAKKKPPAPPAPPAPVGP